MITGILLIGHGTRELAGVREFLELAERVKALAPALPVAACFLELAEPTIAAGLKTLMDQGVQRVIVAPLLLFSAGHHQRDVPEAVSAALAAYPGIEVAQLPALNCHPRLLALSQRRLAEARLIAGPTDYEAASENRLLLIVGRGSSDPGATSRLREFVARRAGEANVQTVLSCFVHGQHPTLAEGLELAGKSAATTIYVQPHLLFQGLVLQEIEVAVTEKASRCEKKRWFLAPPLGPDEEVAQAVLELAEPWLSISPRSLTGG